VNTHVQRKKKHFNGVSRKRSWLIAGQAGHRLRQRPN